MINFFIYKLYSVFGGRGLTNYEPCCADEDAICEGGVICLSKIPLGPALSSKESFAEVCELFVAEGSVVCGGEPLLRLGFEYNTADLSSPCSGKIVEVFRGNFKNVKKGTPLFKVEPT